MKRNILFAVALIALQAQAQRSGGISEKMLHEIQKEQQLQAGDRALMNAIAANAIDNLTQNRENAGAIDTHFSIETRTQSITDQKSSGRCWMFSGMNVLRGDYALRTDSLRVNFSQAYLFFWDQLEKANLMLQGCIETADKPMDDVRVQFFFRSPIGDGGTFCGVADLADKYGLVPAEVMPESFSTDNTSKVRQLIASKLREYGLQLREMVQKGKKSGALEKAKSRMLSQIYHMLQYAIGNPPQKFTYAFKNSRGNAVGDPKEYTPMTFYQEVMGGKKLNGTFIMVMNDPRREYYKTYEVELDRHMQDGHNWKYVNLPMDDIEEMAIAAMRAGHKLYSSYDVGKMLDRKRGYADTENFDYGSLFGTNFPMTKAERIATFDSGSTHAMTLTAVDLDKRGKATKWKVENSWGSDWGQKGCLIMTDRWLREYMFRLVVPNEFVTEKVMQAWQTAPVMVMPEDPLFLPDEQATLGSGIDLGNLDTSARPADDFYQYACGGWMQKHPLPAAYSRFGSFDMLGEENNKRINGILDELLHGTYAEGTTEKKLSDLYKLAMDSVKRDADGVEPAMGILRQMEKAKTKQQLFDIQLQLAPYGNSEFYHAGIGADEKNASQNILQVRQGGLTLGMKDYYLDNDAETTKIREAYKQHIVRMFQRFGFSKAQSQKKMKNIMRLETELAKVSRSRTELRDPQRNYNKTTLAEFAAAYPNLQLERLMNAQGVDSKYIQELVVGQPEFMAGADKLLAAMTVAEYRDYMEWGQIMTSASYLDAATQQANFEFFGKVMSGRKEDHPLWRRATMQMESQMGQALGKIYAEKYFPEAAKKRMIELVRNLQIALGERIAAQDWMSDSTKVNALLKLNSFYVKVGYPDKWINMAKLQIDASKSYYENIRECHKFWTAYEIDHTAGKPVDRDDWYMYPQTVNAYYNPTTNEICFPAGILQKPFFDMQADDAFNYGAIGVVIGHEMTHGFDDQGRQFDKDGNMHDWWAVADGEQFKARTDKYADFFSAIKVLPDLNANGRLTLGENLADHGGLQVAYAAFKNAMRGSQLPVIDGFTPEQRFFLAYSGVWAGNITDEEIRNRTKSDPHALGRWRVNGALPHIDAWYEAFGVKQGDKMFIPKEQRLPLW